jgi:hypothetical protein
VTRKLSGYYPNPWGRWVTEGGAGFVSSNHIHIFGYYITGKESGMPIFNPVEIGDIELYRSGKRLQVVFNYLDDVALADYFDKFLNEFKNDWPEASPQTKKRKVTEKK